MKNQEQHIEKINNAIDAIIYLEDFYSQMPSELSLCLSRLNSLRNIAEEEIEVGDKVYDSFNGETEIVSSIGARNFFFESEKLAVGKQFCFKAPY